MKKLLIKIRGLRIINLYLLLLSTLVVRSFSEQTNTLINIVSDPKGAMIIIDGKETGKKTPTLLHLTDTKEHSIELSLPYHLFSKRLFTPVKDSTITLSYKLVSLSDTTLIITDLELGILTLTSPPIKTPYIIDDKPFYEKEAILNAGLHKIDWRGRGVYTSLDTVVEVFPGRMTTLNFSPKRLSGVVSLSVLPEDAEISLNEIPYGVGAINKNVNTGTYNLKVSRNGFFSQERSIKVTSSDTTDVNITLVRVPDEDGDGFLDSVDLCPKLYGIYDGCPKQKKHKAIRKYFNMLGNNIISQPFSFELTVASWQSRLSYSKKFTEFSSYFNDGKKIFNNHTGLSLFNSAKIIIKGFLFEVEYGEYRSGLKYNKSYGHGSGPVIIKKENDTTTYVLFSDSLANLSPSLYFPSVSISLGANFNINRFNLSFIAGYQWEDIFSGDIITYANLQKYLNGDLTSEIDGVSYGGELSDFRFSNDFFYVGTGFSFDLLKSKRNNLAITGKVKLSLYSEATKGWTIFNLGLTYKFTPSIKKEIGISTKTN